MPERVIYDRGPSKVLEISSPFFPQGPDTSRMVDITIAPPLLARLVVTSLVPAAPFLQGPDTSRIVDITIAPPLLARLVVTSLVLPAPFRYTHCLLYTSDAADE